MKEILLTQGKTTKVDDVDYESLNQHSWCAHNIQGMWYAERRHQNKLIYLHRVVLGASICQLIDHVDGNGLNNQRHNLRLATKAQNSQNRPLQSNSTSGYKGVSFDKRAYKWSASIKVNRRKVSLGFFTDITQAALKYNEAALQYFGEFAYLNTVKEVSVGSE